MPYTFEKNDIGLLRTDGSTKVGMMLATDSKGIPIYEVLDDEYLAEQRTETPGYAGLPYEKEMRLGQDDWRAGFGLEVYDATDPKRYFSSINMDGRFRNMFICGPKSTGIAIPGGSAYPRAFAEFNDELYVAFGKQLSKLNGSGDGWTAVNTFNSNITALESFADGFLYIALQSDQIIEDCEDAWVSSDAEVTVSLDTGDYKVGSGSVKCEISAAHTTGDIAEEAITSLDLSGYGGVALWIKSSIALNAADVVLEVNENGNATRINIPALNANEWTRVYILYDFDAADNAITAVLLDMVVDKGAMTLWVDDIRAADRYHYMDSGENITESTLTDGFAKLLTAVGTTLWKGLLPRELKSATDPTNSGSWSGVTSVDSSDKDITDMLSFNNALYILKEDRPFYLDSSGNVQILTNITRPIGNSTSGKNSLEWQANIYMPWGDQGLLEYGSVDGYFVWRNPAKFVTNEANFVGRVQALGADEEYLFAIVDNSAKVEVLAGRLETIGTTTGWVWHPIHELTLTGCETAFVSNVYKKRLWIASTASGDSLYYIDLPTGYGDITNDANRNFLTGGHFETPWLHGEFKGDKKAFYKLTLKLGHAYDADIYFKAYYKLWGETSWSASIGDFKGTSGNRIASNFIDVANTPDSEFIKFKIEALTDDVLKTPVLLDYECKAILYPPRRRIIRCIARCADDVINKQGSKDENIAKDVKDALEEASADATWPVTFYDIDGTTKTVRLLPTNPFSKVVKREKIGDKINTERYFFLNLQEVTLS